MKQMEICAQDVVVLLLLVMTAVALLASCGQNGDSPGQTCNFPTLVESTPDGGDQLFLCGNGDILECRDGSCALGGGNSGNPNSGNTTDSNNPTNNDSNNRFQNLTPLPSPTPTPERNIGR